MSFLSVFAGFLRVRFVCFKQPKIMLYNVEGQKHRTFWPSTLWHYRQADIRGLSFFPITCVPNFTQILLVISSQIDSFTLWYFSCFRHLRFKNLGAPGMPPLALCLSEMRSFFPILGEATFVYLTSPTFLKSHISSLWMPTFLKASVCLLFKQLSYPSTESYIFMSV
jgi:hypothetical protein